jgi:hypothetical protein
LRILKWKAQTLLRPGEMKEVTVELTKWNTHITALEKNGMGLDR